MPLDKQKGVQGSQFTGAAFTGALAEAGVAISMDGRGRWMDNVFIERLWRSLKYEDVYLKGYADGREAARGIAEWVAFYNDRRPHQALADRTPMAVWREAVAGAQGCGHDGQRIRVAHMPTAATADAASRCVIERNPEQSRFQLKSRLKRSRCEGPFQSRRVMLSSHKLWPNAVQLACYVHMSSQDTDAAPGLLS